MAMSLSGAFFHRLMLLLRQPVLPDQENFTQSFLHIQSIATLSEIAVERDYRSQSIRVGSPETAASYCARQAYLLRTAIG